MGFFDYWVGRSLGYFDELSIAHGVMLGSAQVDSKHESIVKDMVYFSQNKSVIMAENGYQKDLKRASSEVSKRFGWLKFSPLHNPERLTKQQKTEAINVIDMLRRDKIIAISSAERMLKLLD
jgi:hypothetical protein